MPYRFKGDDFRLPRGFVIQLIEYFHHAIEEFDVDADQSITYEIDELIEFHDVLVRHAESQGVTKDEVRKGIYGDYHHA